MRSFFIVAMLELAACAMAGEVALAQQEVPASPFDVIRPVQAVVALESYTVRQTIKFTDEQERSVRSILDRTKDARMKYANGFTGDVNLDSDQKKARRAERLAEMRATYEEANKDALSLLDDSQIARINQIRIWILRERALFTAEVANELKFTDMQINDLVTAFQQYGKKLLELPVPKNKADEEGVRKRKEQTAILDRESGAEYLRILTKEQTELFDKMRGPKFEAELSEFPTLWGDRPTR